MSCPKCGADYGIGDWPFCRGNPSDHGSGFAAVHGDEMDHLQKNGLAVPRRFTSKAEHERWRKENGYTVKVHWPGMYDDYTAQNVRELLERSFTQVPEPSVSMNIRTYTGDATVRPDGSLDLKEHA